MPKDNKPKLTIPKVLLRGILYTIVIPVVAIMVIVGGLYLKSSFELNSTQADMKGYLQNKYGQEFVVENYRIEGAGIGVEGDPEADAYPVDNENLSFKVVDTGEYKAGKHSYYDTYPDKLWSTKIDGRLNSMVNDTFGDGVSVSQIELNSDISVGRDINGDIPAYEEAFSKYGKKIYLTIRLKGSSAQSDISEKIFAFILSVRKLEVSLAINYEDTQSALWMEDNAIQRVDTPNDILKYVKDK